MEIVSVQTFPGKNIYSHKPVCKMVIDITPYANGPTGDIPGFNTAIMRLLPGLADHRCGIGTDGGFAERLNEGIYLGHAIEHIAIELQAINGHNVYYGKTRVINEPSLYYIIFEFKDERCGIEAGKAAFRLAEAIAGGLPFEAAPLMEHLAGVFNEVSAGPGTSAILEEAAQRGIPVTTYADNSMVQFGYGRYARYMSGTLTDSPSCTSVDMASNKQLTKKLLEDHGIPVPPGETVYTEAGAVDAASGIGFPVVVKPCSANQGKGVTMNIASVRDIPAAFAKAAAFGNSVIVEKMIIGRDYRLLVINGHLSAACERIPPYITGDGSHTVNVLIEIVNADPLRGCDHEKPLTRIKADGMLMDVLRRFGKGMEDIPAAGEKVVLRDNANLSTGGTARDCTSEVNPKTAEIAVRSAAILGLDIAGVDITAEDISEPLNQYNGAVIEVNAAPGIRMHLFPSTGEPRNVAKDIVDMLFPSSNPFSVPVVSVTGTNGKTTATRLISHTLSLMGMKVGMTCTSGIYIGDRCVLKGDNTGPASARVVLSDRTIDAAVLETARGGIIRKGLAYDLADVGLITNISDDHLGIDGINSIEEMAFVKSLVTEAVKPGGYAVLNADDPMTPYFSARTKAGLVLFSRKSDNTFISEHMKNGGRVVYSRNSKLYYFNGSRNIPIIDISDIPITLKGAAGFNVENSLAAASALFALDVPVAAIKKGLRTFMPDTASNPGRLNIFDLGSFRVMLDYGHNTAGYHAVTEAMKFIGARNCIGVIGMPGDRMDRSISEVGQICGSLFSKLYIKEDRDLRGRRPGETADLLYKGALQSGINENDLTIILSETDALKAAMENAVRDDMIIMFYEEFEPALEIILEKMKSMKAEAEEEEMIVPAAVQA